MADLLYFDYFKKRGGKINEREIFSAEGAKVERTEIKDRQNLRGLGYGTELCRRLRKIFFTVYL